MFLAVTKKTVIDTPAMGEIFAQPDAVPPIVAVPAVPAVTHEEVDQTYIEDDSTTIARNLATGLGIEYYHIVFDSGLVATLASVALKTGTRVAAPAREVAEIAAGGRDVGSAIVDP